MYEVDLCEVGEGQYVVNFRYGRRGTNLKDGTKTVLPVGAVEAEKIVDALVVSKTQKGYHERGTAAPPPSRAATVRARGD